MRQATRLAARERSTHARALALGITLVAMAAPGVARAQSSLGGYALDQLEPAPAGDEFFGVPSAGTPGHLVPRVYLMFDYAHEPLRLAGGDAVVSSQGFARVDASLTLFDRLLFSVDVPVAVLQDGDEPTVNGVTLASPTSAAMGDVRLGLRARIFGANRGPMQLGIGGYLFLPTAGSDSFAGDGAVRVSPHLGASGRLGGETALVYSAAGGAVLRTSGNPHSVTYGGGVALSFADDLVQIGPEAYGSTQIGDDAPLTSPSITVASESRTALEILGGAKLRPWEGLVFGVAAGAGITGAIGTPSFRAIGMVGWAPLPEREATDDRDPDRDGVLGAADACPAEAGVTHHDPDKHGCPSRDRDGDLVPDALDACPGEKGRENADATRNGCPADYDQDGIADATDACPNQKGVASVEPARHGCPGEVDGDSDGIADRSDACPRQRGVASDDPAHNGCPPRDGDADGIADADDACPTERGIASNEKRSHGCPAAGSVAKQEIVILKQVQFKLGEASLDQTVDPISDDLLTEVRDVMVKHPEIEVLEVQGHADETGGPGVNMVLSRARADAVRSWLVKRGIDGRRLVARGYGSSRPVATNADDSGRQRNRRVELVVSKKRAVPASR